MFVTYTLFTRAHVKYTQTQSAPECLFVLLVECPDCQFPNRIAHSKWRTPLAELLQGVKVKYASPKASKQESVSGSAAIAKIVVATHPVPSAPLWLTTVASDCLVVTTFQQHVDGWCKPLSSHSKRYQAANSRCSTHDKVLLAVYLALRHFRHTLDDHPFMMFTDHTPLVYALHTTSDWYLPLKIRHLDFVPLLTMYIRHGSGAGNFLLDLEIDELWQNSPLYLAVVPVGTSRKTILRYSS